MLHLTKLTRQLSWIPDKAACPGEVRPARAGTADALQRSVYSPCLKFPPLFIIFLEPNAGQIQEGIGEAVNNIVKHFHKPEKEV